MVHTEFCSYSEALQSHQAVDVTFSSAEMKTGVKTALTDREDEEGRQ